MREFSALFLFAGLGAGARGFLEARAELGGVGARMRCVAGVDNDPLACADFERLTGGRAVCADLATMTPAELRAIAGDAAPDIVFSSSPCKGLSGLLSKAASAAPKYEAMNRLVLQGIFLAVEAWPENPPGLLVLENVPRITTRGATLLAQVRQLLTGYGYVLHESSHDLGELGGLAQHRRRFLLVARRPAKVSAYVFRPPVQRVRACGEVLEALPLPEDARAGELHRLPRLSWVNWCRLALIPAGGDWRDLPGVVPDGAERREVFARHDVRPWGEPARTVAGSGSNGVHAWEEPHPTVVGGSTSGRGAVADPRIPLARTADGAGSFKGRPGLFGVSEWNTPAPTVTGSARVCASNAPAAIADPRLRGYGPSTHNNVLRVTPFDEPTGTITGSGRPSSGAICVADPRVPLGCAPRNGAYGVTSWAAPSATVTGSACIDNGPVAVADPRVIEVPPSYRLMTIEEALAQGDGAPPPGVVPVIVAADGTWHRPLTTLELAVLQALPAVLDGAPLRLAGRSVARWRERIGNAVPVDAARAIGESLLQALLASALGMWTLGSTGIWVREHEAVA